MKCKTESPVIVTDSCGVQVLQPIQNDFTVYLLRILILYRFILPNLLL